MDSTYFYLLCPDNFWRSICFTSGHQEITWLMDCCCKNGKLHFYGFAWPILFSNICCWRLENIPLGTHYINFHLILFICVKQVGGVHSHLISRVQRDKCKAGCFMSQNDIMMTVFPMFQQHIEPHLVHAHVSRHEIA